MISAGSFSLKFQSLADHYRRCCRMEKASGRRVQMQRRLSVEINLTSTRYLTDISVEIRLHGRREESEKSACMRIEFLSLRRERDALAVGEGRESINTHAVSRRRRLVVISFIPGVKCLRDKLNCSAQMPLADKKCAPGRNNKIIVI